ncbi:hypothetical protein ACFL2T_02280 [Elusimicrobiota bacterium]
MRQLALKIAKLAANPWLQLFISAVLIFTSGKEVLESFKGGLHYSDIGAHHGVFLMAVVHFLRIFPDIFTRVEAVKIKT